MALLGIHDDTDNPSLIVAGMVNAGAADAQDAISELRVSAFASKHPVVPILIKPLAGHFRQIVGSAFGNDKIADLRLDVTISNADALEV